MRLATLALLGLLALLPMTAHAQSYGHVFSSASCQQVPCMDSANSLSSSDLAAKAVQCLQNNMGVNSTAYDSMSQLDNNNCLISNLTADPTKNMLPHCCVVALNNSCYLTCQLVMR